MQISDILLSIEHFAPLNYQESYDNSGLQVGSPQMECTGILLSLDITEEIIDEAVGKGCNLIIAHHPLIFGGIKKITGKTAVERCIVKAIQHNIVLYAAHTNLDNVTNGVNFKIAEKLGLESVQILSPAKNKLLKLYTFVPAGQAATVREALYAAGAGAIGNYSKCSFNTEGIGTFKPGNAANPYIGNTGGKLEEVKEIKIEVLVPEHCKNAILAALISNHPYEEVAYELIKIENENMYLGAGVVGRLPQPLPTDEVLALIKDKLKAPCIRYTKPSHELIQKIALCGGSGSFLLAAAKASGAELYLTADFKYHQFFEAENQITIADIGHFESEQFTLEIFESILKQTHIEVPILYALHSSNPVQYYV
jgi:dinuclear metal center YbgI/SA1388 family protein